MTAIVNRREFSFFDKEGGDGSRDTKKEKQYRKIRREKLGSRIMAVLEIAECLDPRDIEKMRKEMSFTIREKILAVLGKEDDNKKRLIAELIDDTGRVDIRNEKFFGENAYNDWDRAVNRHRGVRDRNKSREEVEREKLVRSGEQLEILKTAVLNRFFGERFVSVRSSVYDDVYNGVDNLVLDTEEGVYCALDEVADKRGGERMRSKQEKKKKEGLTWLRYGIEFKKRGKSEVEIKRLQQEKVPRFLLSLPEKEVKEGMKILIKEMKLEEVEKELQSEKLQKEGELKLEDIEPDLEEMKKGFNRKMENYFYIFIDQMRKQISDFRKNRKFWQKNFTEKQRKQLECLEKHINSILVGKRNADRKTKNDFKKNGFKSALSYEM